MEMGRGEVVKEVGRIQPSPDLYSWHCGSISLGLWAETAGFQRGVPGLEQGKVGDTLERIIIGKHEAFKGTKEPVQVGSL